MHAYFYIYVTLGSTLATFPGGSYRNGLKCKAKQKNRKIKKHGKNSRRGGRKRGLGQNGKAVHQG